MFTVTRKNKLINTVYDSVSYSCYKFPFTNTQLIYNGDNVIGTLEKKSKEVYVLKSNTNEEIMIIHHSKNYKKKNEPIQLRLVFPTTLRLKKGMLYKTYHEHTIDTIDDIVVFDNSNTNGGNCVNGTNHMVGNGTNHMVGNGTNHMIHSNTTSINDCSGNINIKSNIQSSKTVQIKWKDNTIYSCTKTQDNTFLVTYLKPVNRLQAFAVFLSLTY